MLVLKENRICLSQSCGHKGPNEVPLSSSITSVRADRTNSTTPTRHQHDFLSEFWKSFFFSWEMDWSGFFCILREKNPKNSRTFLPCAPYSNYFCHMRPLNSYLLSWYSFFFLKEKIVSALSQFCIIALCLPCLHTTGWMAIFLFWLFLSGKKTTPAMK